MNAKEKMKNLPLFQKVLLFSFFITFLVVVSTAGISLILHSNQIKEQMTDRVSGLASLWSVTISPEDIEQAVQTRDKEHPAVKRLENIVSLINERNSPFLDSYLLSPDIKNGNDNYIIAVSKQYERMGLSSLSYYKKSNKEFIRAFNETKKTKRISTTSIYEDEFGTWVTAFAPIKNGQGGIIALLGIEVDASVLKAYEKRLLVIMLSSFFVITILVYFTLRWGLSKVMEPINEIIHGINEVSSGNFNVRLQVGDSSDLGKLSERFNMMTRQLSIIFDRLSATSKQLGPPKQEIDAAQWDIALDEIENILRKTKLQKELQRAEKMNAIGQLAASVAHEIRNPMTVVKGFLQIFLAKEQMSDEERMYIKLMIDEMNRAETIINDYLSLAKPDMKQMEQVDAGKLAHKVMDLMNSYAMMSKSIELEIDLQKNVIIKGNESELKQVLINMLKNGIEAMRNGGTLRLKVEKTAKYGTFVIQDTGIGMSAEELKRLGTAFYSLKEKGTGMGLMVCYQIIERMKGRIEVESSIGEGTTFRIYVPLQEEHK